MENFSFLNPRNRVIRSVDIGELARRFSSPNTAEVSRDTYMMKMLMTACITVKEI